MSTRKTHGLAESVAHLQEHLYRYVARKAGFADHPRLSPERTRRLLDGLGRPDDHQHIVWVLGTKGKGSTAAILEAILGPPVSLQDSSRPPTCTARANGSK